MGLCLLNRLGASSQNAAVKVGADPRDGFVIFGILHPQDLVVAGIIVFRKVDVVFPEQVICNQAAAGMKDDCEILQAERFRRCGEEPRKKMPSQGGLLGRGFCRRIELQRRGILLAGFVQAALDMKFNAALVVPLGSVL